ncbi:MAG: RluA family pseudouridine synthase [Saprospiraceae bacterium]|nr:RluA family pseudouridine synthase [Saprospiraceae bacterium]
MDEGVEIEDTDELFDEQLITVDPGQAPLRIDRYLMYRITKLSRSKIQKGIAQGLIKVNGQVVKANYKVQPADDIIVRYPRYDDSEKELVPEAMDLDIAYEDEHLLVVNKPVGLVVHPGISNWRGTLVNGLLHHVGHRVIPSLEGNPPNRPGLVHRIDKNTSGLLVIAKDAESLTHLAKQFFDHTIDRQYLALVWGQPQQEEGTIDRFLGRDPKDPTRQTVFEDGESGKRAITHYHIVEPLYYVSLVRCWLETGRTHQIRIHFKSLGHPLFGDEKYGGDRIMKGTIFQKYRQFVQNCLRMMPHQALHATYLAFDHPISGKRLQFEVPPPENFTNVLKKWRQYVSTRRDKRDLL